MRTLLRTGLMVTIIASVAASAVADTKITRDVETALQENPRVRVLVVTRPDPDLPNGGPAVVNPTAYLAARLGGSAAMVKPIGRLPVALAELNRTAVEQLRVDPNVALVVRDVPVPPVLIDTVPMIRANAFHSRQWRGANTTVAVLDTGIDASHAAFTGSIAAQACFSTPSSTVYAVSSLCPNGLDVSLLPDAAQGCPASIEGCSHGTHVAGIAAGHGMEYDGTRFDGVAPGARVLPVQVFSLFDGGNVCGGASPCVLSFTSDQLRALEWVYKHREAHNIAAVNMSLGGGYADRYCDSTSALTEIIDRLKAKGVPTVIAAGNSGFYDGVAEPACISSAIAVSALDKRGKLDVRYSNVSQGVDIAAPGTAVVSSVYAGQFAALSGTSMAAPHVAGAFALLREAYPTLSAYELEARLKDASRIVSDPRTGLKLFRLELTVPGAATAGTATPTGAVSAGGANAVAPTPASGASPAVVSGSFIVRTLTLEAEPSLTASLTAGCTNVECRLKQIGERSFSVEVSPKADLSPEQRKSVVISREALQNMLKDKGMAVFDNRAFAPNLPVGKF